MARFSYVTSIGASFSLSVSADGTVSTRGSVSDAQAAAASFASGIDRGEGNDSIVMLSTTIPGIAAIAPAAATGAAASLDFAD